MDGGGWNRRQAQEGCWTPGTACPSPEAILGKGWYWQAGSSLVLATPSSHPHSHAEGP